MTLHEGFVLDDGSEHLSAFSKSQYFLPSLFYEGLNIIILITYIDHHIRTTGSGTLENSTIKRNVSRRLLKPHSQLHSKISADKLLHMKMSVK